jgi:hypothetical protein
MSKMGSHDPFGYLKHKLWPKEALGVKLPIWLLITKSQESFGFPCVKVAYHIPLENSQQGQNFCFRPHLYQRSINKVMSLQSCKSFNFGNFEIPTWESRDKMTFGCSSCGQAQRILQGGRWWRLLKFRPWWVLWVRVCSWLIHAPKVF